MRTLPFVVAAGVTCACGVRFQTGQTEATGGAAGMGGAVVGGGAAPCGDGVVHAVEWCDDANPVNGDGCSDCAVDEGYACDGEPSACAPIEPEVVTLESLALDMSSADCAYDGTLASMTCASVLVVDKGYTAVQRVEVGIAMSHTWVGDLVIKVASPATTVTTLLSRPGFVEPQDTTNMTDADSSDLLSAFAIQFTDDGPQEAELMGDTLDSAGVVCRDDDACVFAPSHGAGPGVAGLDDFAGEAPSGEWSICVGDADCADVGVIDMVRLSVLAW